MAANLAGFIGSFSESLLGYPFTPGTGLLCLPAFVHLHLFVLDVTQSDLDMHIVSTLSEGSGVLFWISFRHFQKIVFFPFFYSFSVDTPMKYIVGCWNRIEKTEEHARTVCSSNFLREYIIFLNQYKPSKQKGLEAFSAMVKPLLANYACTILRFPEQFHNCNG